jgi:exodeoxyribonuclease VII small subunit
MKQAPGDREFNPDSKLDAPGVSGYFLPMSKPAKAGDPAKVTLPFEAALKKLAAVVEAMEADDLPLETLLAKYEEGAQLVQICQEKLAEAELKIQQLEKNAAGEMKLKPLDPAAD